MIAMALCLYLASDFGAYLSHVAFHRIDFLWEFHKVHHSAEVLTPLTDQRVHPVQQLVTRTVSGIMLGACLGAFDYLFAYEITAMTVAGINVFSIALTAISSNLNHSHVWISFGPILNRIFISPASHQIHHSADTKHYNKNYGSSFAIWDSLFGTFHLPGKIELLKFGLGDAEWDQFKSVSQIYFRPFRRSASILVRKINIKRNLNVKAHPKGEVK